MIAVLQRVSRASVRVEERVTGQIQLGLLVFLGVEKGDTDQDAEYLANRIVHLRVFPDTAQKLNCSLIDASGSMLVVSQFTLVADVSRGRRPSFDGAAVPQQAALLYERFLAFVRQTGVSVETGVFQAQMSVDLTNEGPVTFICRSKPQNCS